MTLQVGDKVKPLAGLTWLQGDEFQIADPETPRPVLVEFWSTWCGPCVQVIPHLNAMYHALGDQIRLVGITNEPASTVTPFLQHQEALDYPIALDENGRAWTDYMDAAGMGGIPHAFLVGADGTLLWQGHSAAADQKIQAVLSGKLTSENAVQLQQQDALLEEYGQLLQAGRDPERQEQIVTLLRKAAADPDAMQARLENLRQIAAFRGQVSKVQDLLQKDPDAEIPAELTAALVSNAPPGVNGPLIIESVRLGAHLQFFAVAAQRRDAATVAKHRDAIMRTQCSDPTALLQVTELFLDGTQLPEDAEVAVALATRAVELTERQDSEALTALGQALYADDQPAAALESVKAAKAIATDISELQTLDYLIKRYSDG